MSRLYRTLLALTLPACLGGAIPRALAQPPAVAVEVAPVTVARATVRADAVGSLLANEAVTLRPEFPGRVVGIHFTEGQRVQSGERLFTLDPDEYRARLAQSEAEAELARVNFQRAEDLYRQKIASRQDYDSAVAKLKAAEATRELDRVRLEKTTIRAPFAGTLGVRQVSPGDYVQEAQALGTLVADDPIKLELRLPERYATWVRAGHALRMRVDALPGREFEGRVYVLDPALDPLTRTLVLRARVENPEGLLRPGMFARASTVLEQREEALWVPEQAIVPRQARQYVYRVSDGRAAEVEVTTGLREGGRVEVLSGLAAGDSVVTAGHTKLRPGTPVKAVTPPPGVGGPEGESAR
jgi:membrane fusion protein (multidrug efflux system)